MIDASWILLAFCSGVFAGAWVMARECANACLHGKRKWWKAAIFCAEQRIALRTYRLELDEVAELEHSVNVDGDAHKKVGSQ
jgi:hypothetical protein